MKPPSQKILFVVSEKNGVWGAAQAVPGIAALLGPIWDKAEEAPGTAKLNVGGAAEFDQVTCTSAGNCLGVGSYAGKKSSGPFAVTEQHGTWGKARTFPRIMARTTVQARDL